MNVKTLRAAYDFLKGAAFYDIRIPARLPLKFKKFDDAWAYFLTPPHRIQIDPRTSDPNMLLRALAHEMVHLALEVNAECDHDHHDENFHQLARIVCRRMHWPTKGF